MPNRDTVFEYWPYNHCVVIKKLSARESCSLKLLQEIQSAGGFLSMLLTWVDQEREDSIWTPNNLKEQTLSMVPIGRVSSGKSVLATGPRISGKQPSKVSVCQHVTSYFGGIYRVGQLKWSQLILPIKMHKRVIIQQCYFIKKQVVIHKNIINAKANKYQQNQTILP